MNMPKISKRFEVFNKAEENEATIYMYGSIGNGWFSDISSKDVRNQLSNITAKVIKIHINSPGGDVFESIAISNLLKNHNAEIHVYIDGLAASGASVIAMSGDKIIMPKNTMMMIHKAWTFAAGNSKELRKVADDLEKIDNAVVESYTSRFVGERDELTSLLDTDTWLTAEECKALGFCDEIVDEVVIEESEEEKQDEEILTKESILNKYVALGNKQNQSTEEHGNTVNNKEVLVQFFNSFKTAQS